MLKSVCFSNFVKFKEFHYLDFSNDSPSIFIGENGTGKSSVLEGIRRCLKPELSTSASSIPDPKTLSYFICYFENVDDGKNVLSGIVALPDELEKETTDSSGKDLTAERSNEPNSADIKRSEPKPQSVEYQGNKINDMHDNDTTGKAPTQQNTNTRCVYKFVTEYFGPGEESLLYVAPGYQNLESHIFDEWRPIQTDHLREMVKYCIDTQKPSEESEEYILRCLSKIFNRQTIADNINVPLQSENEGKTLIESLSKEVVFTFPLHSIGPLQWSKSPRICLEMRDKNYTEAEDRCEIIKYFFENGDQFYKDKEREYFKLITQTDNNYFVCNKVNGVSKVSNGKHGLFKIPEGIYEAKIISILLSSKCFKTIILEEPDRGMHPQFVNRMMQVIEDSKEDKRQELDQSKDDKQEIEESKEGKRQEIEQKNDYESQEIEQGKEDKRQEIERSKGDKQREIKQSKENKQRRRVILTTHNKALITPWSLQKCFVFRNFANNRGDVKFCIFSPQKILGDPENVLLKNMRELTSDHLSDIFFARKILFFEGDSEMLFFTELQQQILRGELKDKKCFESVQLKKTFSELTLVKMNGKDKEPLCHDICERLQLEHLVVVDGKRKTEDIKENDEKHCKRNTTDDKGIVGVNDKNVDKENDGGHVEYKDKKKSQGSEKNFVDDAKDEGNVKNVRDSEDKDGKTNIVDNPNDKDGDEKKEINSLGETDRHQIGKKTMETGTFSWVDGEIEDMVLAMFVDKPQLITELEKQNVKLKRAKPGKKRKTDEKLFLHKDVTLQNVTAAVKIITENCKETDDLNHLIKELGKDRLYVKEHYNA